MKNLNYFTLFARIALAVGFLSAVADRFGLWTPVLGEGNVFWGNMKNFTDYTGVLLPWMPSVLVTVCAWIATVAELVLGVLLLAGKWMRWTGLLSGVLLLLFAFAMMTSLNVKAPFDYSVFTAAACAFMLCKED